MSLGDSFDEFGSEDWLDVLWVGSAFICCNNFSIAATNSSLEPDWARVAAAIDFCCKNVVCWVSVGDRYLGIDMT